MLPVADQLNLRNLFLFTVSANYRRVEVSHDRCYVRFRCRNVYIRQSMKGTWIA
jgi:hypothetical protein